MLQHRRGQPRSLSNKVVAITGGARGIGYATARALAHRGARVAIGDLDGDLAAQVAAELGGDAFGVGVDVTDTAGFCEVVALELRGTGVEMSVVRPSLCNAELTAGFKGLRGMSFIGHGDVDGRIVETLQGSRFDV